MRYVPTGCLREGMMLAKNLYGINNSLVLAQGQRLTAKYIEKLYHLGYQGVYIDDDLTRDIEIVNVIKDELRQKTVATVRNVFIHSTSGDRKGLEKSFDQTRESVSKMIDEILSNKNLMVNMVDLKVFNDYTFYHSVNVAVLSIVLGIALGYNYNSLYHLGLGALLHDVGKVFMPPGLLDKSGPLTDEEFVELRRHPQIGHEYLTRNCVFPYAAYTAVLQHHERFDGSGYPYGLVGDKISRNGRVVAVADVYAAMVSDRPYRKAIQHAEVIEYIFSRSDTMFDPEIVQAFHRKIAPYPIGTIVLLSNGEKGIVIENFENFGTRPRVRLLSPDGTQAAGDISLRDDKDYLSVTVLSCEF